MARVATLVELEERKRAGFVSLVGAGPGDPELLTVKALKALQNADVVVVDRLVAPTIRALAPAGARVIEVGKAPGRPSTPQARICAILVREARAGHRVVRLKGGDPLVFGRAVEELAALTAAGVAFEIVPGITAALGCAAAVAVPLTGRGERRELVLLTGHATDGAAEHDWPALARPGRTLAIYMGVGAAPHIQARLLDAGIDPQTPLTIVENGTLPRQKVLTGRIADLVALVGRHRIRGPAVIFIGAHPLRAAAAPVLVEAA
jgi:uroporphyrin-III C-methyltransferase/precorrin-2 dehydrogenase/sirohydrochlorin ferrochelatase